MNDKPNHTKLAAKIQALLAQAEGEAAAGNEAARDTFLEKAAALQLKYAIEDAMLLRAHGVSADEITHADFCLESNTPLIKAKRQLINGLANLNRGKAVMTGEYKRKKNGGMRYDRRAKVRVYAHQSDLDFITMLYNSLILQMQTMMAADERAVLDGRKVNTDKRTVGYGQAWRVSYAYAWVDRVLIRLGEAKMRNEDTEETSQSGTALVLRDRTQLVHDYVGERVGKLRATKYRLDNHSEEGRRAGRVAAENADLGGKKVGNATRGHLGHPRNESALRSD